jgi:hypothetical protein
MSTNFSIKPVGEPAAIPVVPPVSKAADNAVTTELPASKSVRVVDAGAGVRNDSPAASDYVSHQVIIDRAAASIVYQVVDNRTNLVLQQFPDEAVLRRRAYFRTLDLTRAEPGHRLVTDRKA